MTQTLGKGDTLPRPTIHYDIISDEPELVSLTTNDQRLLVFKGQLHGMSVKVLADTGAMKRYVKRALVERLGTKMKPLPRTYAVRLPNDACLPVYGTVDCTVTIGEFGDTATFHVLDLDHYDIILGMDFFQQYRPSIDWDMLGLHIMMPTGKVHDLYGSPFSSLQLHMIIDDDDPNIVGFRNSHKAIAHRAGGILYVVTEEPTTFPKPIAEKTEESTGDKELDDILGPLLQVFQEELPKGLGPRRHVDHHIDTGDARSINKMAYSLSPEQLKEQKWQIEYLLDRDLIQPSHSPWGAPVLFTKKKDDSLRMCVDYRALNSVTVKNGYPLPKIQECLDQLGNAIYFTKLDLLSGYWQIRIADEDIPKTTFNTRGGKYEFKVLEFGLTNGLATFQTLMNDILQPFLDKFVVVYLDDILIYSRTREEHLQHIKKVLQKLVENNLIAKQSKCSFLQREIEFCGHIIGNGVVKIDPKKLAMIRDWPTPKMLHQLRQFLGLCTYYRHFIWMFGAIAAALHDLLKVNEEQRRRKHRLIV